MVNGLRDKQTFSQTLILEVVICLHTKYPHFHKCVIHCARQTHLVWVICESPPWQRGSHYVVKKEMNIYEYCS